MLLFLAQTDPSAASLKAWLDVVVYICVGIAAVAVAWSHLMGKNSEREIKPQPFVVKEHETFATDEDMRSVHGRIKREREELDLTITALKEEDRRLRERLDKDIGDLHERINDVPTRVINLLRETKGLI